MSNQNSVNGYSSDADKCPNCGATKVFSAIVCPVCGVSYIEAAGMKRDRVDKLAHFYKDENFEDETEKAPKGPFDPNAALAEFKKNLDGNEDAAKEGEKAPEEQKVIQEETGKQESVEPAPIRPEDNPLNSGLYKERKYRFEEEPEKPSIIMSEKRPEPEPDQTIVPTRYGLDAHAVKEKREQSFSDDAGKNKMFSNTVNNHYEQYKANQESDAVQSTYSTPYNRGTYDAPPEEKPNTWKKILPLAIVLILVLVAGYFLYQYFGL